MGAGVRWIRRVNAETRESVGLIGAKAGGLVDLHRLGLAVPPAFVITSAACRAYLGDGDLPAGLRDELASGISCLEQATGRQDALTVSVRSGASVSMPGMMDTVLDVRASVDAVAAAVRDVFVSWRSPRACTYRELHGIDHELGTAVVVQAMVFGDRDDRSGAGVAFSRNPMTGEDVPYGEVLFGHQGEDVVSGRSLTRPLDDLRTREPQAWAELTDALRRAETHYGDAVQVEFTVETGRLWLLQVRAGGLTGAGAIRVAVDLADEGRITRAEAVARVRPHHLALARTPRLDPVPQTVLLGRGIGACPGVATGRIAVSTASALRMAGDGAVILVRPETSPNDLSGLAAAAGILTSRGGTASHAAVVARSMGKPAVVGLRGLTIVDPAWDEPVGTRGSANVTGVSSGVGEQEGVSSGTREDASVSSVIRSAGPSARPEVASVSSGTREQAGVSSAVRAADGLSDTRAAIVVDGTTLAEGSLITIDGTSGDVALGRVPTAIVAADDRFWRLLGWADDISGDRSQREPSQRLRDAHSRLGE